MHDDGATRACSFPFLRIHSTEPGKFMRPKRSAVASWHARATAAAMLRPDSDPDLDRNQTRAAGKPPDNNTETRWTIWRAGGTADAGSAAHRKNRRARDEFEDEPRALIIPIITVKWTPPVTQTIRLMSPTTNAAR